MNTSGWVSVRRNIIFQWFVHNHLLKVIGYFMTILTRLRYFHFSFWGGGPWEERKYGRQKVDMWGRTKSLEFGKYSSDLNNIISYARICVIFIFRKAGKVTFFSKPSLWWILAKWFWKPSCTSGLLHSQKVLNLGSHCTSLSIFLYSSPFLPWAGRWGMGLNAPCAWVCLWCASWVASKIMISEALKYENRRSKPILCGTMIA